MGYSTGGSVSWYLQSRALGGVAGQQQLVLKPLPTSVEKDKPEKKKSSSGSPKSGGSSPTSKEKPNFET